MSKVNITFPGNLGQVASAADLRGVPSYFLPEGLIYIATELQRSYTYDPSAVGADDGQNIIKPNDLTPAQAGRWIYSVDGIAPGATGATGPASSTYTTLTALKAAPVSNKTYNLAAPSGSDGGVLNGAFTYQAGDFTGNPDAIALDGTPITTGALIRQRERAAVPYAVPYNRITSDRAMDRITVRDFGADAQPVGSNNPDWDTAGFKRALDFMANYRVVTDSPGGSPIYTGPALNVPAGSYRLSQPMTAEVPHAERILFRGEGTNATSIRLVGDIYAIESDRRIESTYISNLTVIGGKGAFRHTYTGDNVSQKHIIENCLFFDYSLSAISSEATDMPYWVIQECVFGGGGVVGAGLTRGVVLGGLQDGSIIRANAFLSNEFHCVLGPLASGSWHFDENDCLSIFVANRTIADLWLRPHDGSISAASPAGQNLFRVETGNGSSIRDNKFGNEGITSYEKKSPKILVAAGGTGDRASSMPDYTWKTGTDGKHYLGGITVSENRFATTDTRDANNNPKSGADANVMDVWVNGLNRIKWLDDNSYDGSSFRYIVEHKSSSRVPDKNNMSWNVKLGPEALPAVYGFTNSPVGHIYDLSGTEGSPFTITPGQVDNSTRVNTVITTPDGWTLNGGVTKNAAANQDGLIDATQFTFDGTGASIQVSSNAGTTGPNRAAWIVTVYMLPVGSPLTKFNLFHAANNRDFKSTVITLRATGRWEPLCLPSPLPSDAQFSLLTLAPINPANGNIITFGDLKLVSSKTPPSL